MSAEDVCEDLILENLSRARCEWRQENPAVANNEPIYMDRFKMYRKFRNRGRGDCLLIALIQHKMRSQGVSEDEIRRRTTGGLDDEMKALVRQLRESIVALADQELQDVLDEDIAADNGRTVEECLKGGEIKSLPMWKKVMATPGAWMDPDALLIGAKILRLDGVALVQARKGNFLYVRTYPSLVRGFSSMILHGGGHFEALYEVRAPTPTPSLPIPVSVATASAPSAPTLSEVTTASASSLLRKVPVVPAPACLVEDETNAVSGGDFLYIAILLGKTSA